MPKQNKAQREIRENTARQHKRQYEWLKDYQWKPGQSGNLKGGPRGKRLKTWAEEFLKALPDEKKLEFLKEMPPEIVWRMAEGNPANTNDDKLRLEHKFEGVSDKELEGARKAIIERLVRLRFQSDKKARKRKG